MEDCSLAYKKVTGDESTCHFDRLIHRRSADDGTMMGQPECWHAKSLPGASLQSTLLWWFGRPAEFRTDLRTRYTRPHIIGIPRISADRGYQNGQAVPYFILIDMDVAGC